MFSKEDEGLDVIYRNGAKGQVVAVHDLYPHNVVTQHENGTKITHEPDGKAGGMNRSNDDIVEIKRYKNAKRLTEVLHDQLIKLDKLYKESLAVEKQKYFTYGVFVGCLICGFISWLLMS